VRINMLVTASVQLQHVEKSSAESALRRDPDVSNRTSRTTLCLAAGTIMRKWSNCLSTLKLLI